MTLYLYRKDHTPLFTMGRIYDGVEFLCSTLEDPVRDLVDLNDDGDFGDPDEGKIYGETAIPAGKYQVKMQHSPTFNKLMPYLQDVPGFTGIMIHGISNTSQTKGCIGVGENVGNGRLVNGPAWSGVIREKITKAIHDGEEVWIEIFNE